MRDINFRAWDKENHKMIYFDFKSIYGYEADGYGERGGVILPDEETHLNYHDGYGDRGINENLEFMLFIGLLDKNGKKMFEGDITNRGVIEFCECLNWDSGGSNHPGFYFKGEYENGEYGELHYHCGFDEEIEVIGNIHENPELLKEK